MAPRLFRTFLLAMLAIALLGPSPGQADDQDKLRSTIAFASSRDFPGPPALNSGEIYLMNPTADLKEQDPRRLTNNQRMDVFPALSPDGKRIVFDSNRLDEPVYTGDLFLMKADGKDQTHLTQGSSATWSPNGKQIAFHASASGMGQPIKGGTGPVPDDSDIFVIDVDDCLEHHAACQDVHGPIKRNLTSNMKTDGGVPTVEDDVDWSPDGDKIAFTSHVNGDGAPGPNQGNDNPTTEIFVMNADGTGDPIQLTDNDEEESAVDWSPDGTRILFACRPEQSLLPLPPSVALPPFEVCVMDVDGPVNNRTQLTHDSKPDDNDPNTPRILVFHGTSVWSPDGTQIVFHRNPVNQPVQAELWSLDIVEDCLGGLPPCPEPLPLTNTPGPGVNLAPNWGVVRITGQGEGQVVAEGKGKNGTADHGKQHKAKDKGKKDTKPKQRHGGGKRHR